MVLINLNNNKEEIKDEFILYTHNFLQKQIQMALEVIKKYIIDNNLLIVGGTAIDYALKIKNDTLYNDLYQVPDFDIISPNNVLHANNIGQLLCDLKYTNISIIPAIHQTTVRVQLLGFTLFDSTFIPEHIYNKIPYLEYNNFKFVHPNFQKINQLLSLSFLYKITGPSFNITNRFKKDIERLQLLENYYVLNNNINFINTLHKIKFNFSFRNINISEICIIDTEVNSFTQKYNSFNEIPDAYFNKDIINNNIIYNFNSNFVFHGELAYNIIYYEFNRIYNKLYSILPLTKIDKEFIKNKYAKIEIHNSYICNSNDIIFDLFNYSNIEFINSNKNNKHNSNDSYSINNFLNKLKQIYNISNIKKLSGILDLLPNYVNGNLESNNNSLNLKIFNLYGNLVSVNLIYNNKINKYLPVTNYNYNLMYFLTNFYLENNEIQKNLNLSYYNSLHSLINIIQYMYYQYPNEFNSSYNFNNSVFNYSLNTNGIKNYADNYLHFILNFKNLIINNKNLDNLPPKNYIGYPNCEIKNMFDKKKSEYYYDFQKEIDDLGISGITQNYNTI
jgi:hypothetical protein